MIKEGAVDSYIVSTVFSGRFGTIFFGFCLIVVIYRLIFGHHKQVVPSPQGFWDKRALKQKVPRSSVSRSSIWSHRGTSSLRIQLTDEAMQHTKLTLVEQVTAWLNKPLGLDGIYVDSVDFAISFSELRLLFKRYLADHNPMATDDTN